MAERIEAESGIAVHAEAAWLHTINDGLIVGLRSFSTWNEALEAAELREYAVSQSRARPRSEG